MEKTYLKKINLLFISIFIFYIALAASAVFGNFKEEKTKPDKFRVEFNRHLSISETKGFIDNKKLKPFSITFSGTGYSCGGLISNKDDIDKLIQSLQGELKKQMLDESLDEQYKQAVKDYLNEVTKDGFKVREIECLGKPDESLEKESFVLKVVSD